MEETAEPAKQSTLWGSPGDRLVVRGHHQGEVPRDAEILEAMGERDTPPFRVRWEDGHEAEVFPGSDCFVQHFGLRAGSLRHSAQD